MILVGVAAVMFRIYDCYSEEFGAIFSGRPVPFRYMYSHNIFPIFKYDADNGES